MPNPIGSMSAAQIGRLAARAMQSAAGHPPAQAEGSFGNVLERALNEVSEVQSTSHNLIEAFVRGEHVELHEVMAAAEEAGIALEMLVEVRNKFIDAYQTVSNMQS